MLQLDIYTDASGNINSNDFGYASFFNFKNVDYYSSYLVDQSVFRNIFKMSSNDKVSNPTVEIFAIRQFLNEFKQNIDKFDLKLKIHLKIHSDYVGCQKWIDKDWIIKKPYISKIVFSIRSIIRRLEEMGVTVEVVWIKGHSGIHGNEMADDLADKRLNESNIGEFFKLLNL